jgi:hypothetical protein
MVRPTSFSERPIQCSFFPEKSHKSRITIYKSNNVGAIKSSWPPNMSPDLVGRWPDHQGDWEKFRNKKDKKFNRLLLSIG